MNGQFTLRGALNTWSECYSATSEFEYRQDGFTFITADWTMACMGLHDSSEALAHYDEAIRRQAICALSGRVDEATVWKRIADALNNEFGLKR